MPPKRNTPLTEEEIENRREANARRQREWYARGPERFKKAMEERRKKLEESFDVMGQVETFEELRELALYTVRDMLVEGKEKDRLAAAKMVLDRTDPQKQVNTVEVCITPVDLSQFRRPSTSEVFEGEVKELPGE